MTTATEATSELLKKFRIVGLTTNSDGTYAIVSNSGKHYTVSQSTHIGRYDGSLYFRWHCDCPARKTCRHIDAVVQCRWDEAAANDDYDGMDIMEREQI